MNNLLIFFALPVAVIIISIALQKILKCPALVSAIIFAIFLVVTFVINNLNFLVATIVYTILSFITAFITCLICRILRRMSNNNCCCNNSVQEVNEVLQLSNGNEIVENSNNVSTCNYQINNQNGISARVNVIPNNANNGQTGNISGCYRRRN